MTICGFAGSILHVDLDSGSVSIELDPDDVSSLTFYKSGSREEPDFYISGSGFVGIGTKNPKSKFDYVDSRSL